MQRLNIDQAVIDDIAEVEFAEAEERDTDIQEDQRRNRVLLGDTTTPVISNGPIKRNDDVRLWDSVEGRVIGPARDSTFFQVHAPDAVDTHGNLITVDIAAVTDRAPVNEEEEPTPWIVPESGPPDHEEGGPVDLAPLQMEAFKQIDIRSDQLISAGFLYNNVIYSCSVEAQIRYSTMMMLADKFTYPLEINSLNDRDKGTITNADEMYAFCLSALAHVRTVVDSGTVQKDIIRGATEVQTILNYVDPRQPPEPIPYNYGENQANAPENQGE
jgi:hypothetical protein